MAMLSSCSWVPCLFCWHHWPLSLPWYSWLRSWPDVGAAGMRWGEITLLTLVCSWLTVCAILDCYSRQVTNLLTLPVMGLSLMYRFGKFTLPFAVVLALVAGLLFLNWRAQKLGGADLKALTTLLLLDPTLIIWAAFGLVISYVGLRTLRGHQAVKKMPAFLGFALGSYFYLANRWFNG